MLYRFLIFFISISIFSYSQIYDYEILKIQSKLFPRVLLMDKNLDKKSPNNEIIMEILYEEIDKYIAEDFKNFLIYETKKLLSNFKIELTQYKNFKKDSNSSAYYLLLSQKDELKSAIKIISSNSRFSFAYDSEYLNYGATIGLYIGHRVSLYINLESIKNSNLEFENDLFKISKVKK